MHTCEENSYIRYLQKYFYYCYYYFYCHYFIISHLTLLPWVRWDILKYRFPNSFEIMPYILQSSIFQGK